MSVLVVGLSHQSAPVAVLEQAALQPDAVPQLLADVCTGDAVDEAVVVSTCNRVEVYAEVSKFHDSVQHISEALARITGVDREALAPYLYVHYEDSAVEHLFAVTGGLDSMVVGESQILGQVRQAYRRARAEQTVGRHLGALAQQALRVGKRVHAETGIDRAGASVVGAALDEAAGHIGSLAGRGALVVGAGSMGALGCSLLRRAGIDDLVVANRTPARAVRVAAAYDGRAADLADLAGEVAAADLVLTCTGATGIVLAAEVVAAAMAGRAGWPLVVVDLALPHDVDPAVRDVPGVTVVDLQSLGTALRGAATGRDVEAARALVAEEVAAFLAWQRASHVGPTVVALRSMAAAVVTAELARLDSRLPGLDTRSRAEVTATVRRVVDKLLHAPTVRVKELAEGPGGHAYAAALRELFDLDPAAPAAVSRASLAVDAGPSADRGDRDVLRSADSKRDAS